MKRIVVGFPVVEWVAKKTNEFGNFGAAIGFGIESDGELIAGVVFNEYNGANMNIHVASDGSKRWMTKELLWMVFDYAFNQAKVKRLTGLVGEKNLDSQRFNKNLGFTVEARLAGAHPDGDMLVYRLWRHECRFLNIRRNGYEHQKAA